MDFRVNKVAADKQPASCIVVGIYESHRLSPAARTINEASGGELLKLVRRFEIQGSVGDALTLNNLPDIKAPRVLLVGCGKKGAMPASQYGRLLAAGAKELTGSGVKDATVYLAELEVEDRDVYWKTRQIVETTRNAVYRFDQLKSEASAVKKPKIRRLVCAIASQRDKRRAEEGIRHGVGISDGVDLARDLGNLPGNICTPTYLADRARQMARSHKSIKVRVLGEPEMKRLGMGTLLSVARGSQEPARLITLEYNPAFGRTRKPGTRQADHARV
jgi:leucyl aminopeptidase